MLSQENTDKALKEIAQITGQELDGNPMIEKAVQQGRVFAQEGSVKMSLRKPILEGDKKIEELTFHFPQMNDLSDISLQDLTDFQKLSNDKLRSILFGLTGLSIMSQGKLVAPDFMLGISLAPLFLI